MNVIKIESPGLSPNIPHKVHYDFSDAELVNMKDYLSKLTLYDLIETDSAAAFFKLFMLIEQWQETSP